VSEELRRELAEVHDLQEDKRLRISRDDAYWKLVNAFKTLQFVLQFLSGHPDWAAVSWADFLAVYARRDMKLA
jgi:hypothetical protein